MKAALEAVAAGQSMSEAAREHGIPKTTLHDRVSGKVIHSTKPGVSWTCHHVPTGDKVSVCVCVERRGGVGLLRSVGERYM